jgi:hypothetical protein
MQDMTIINSSSTQLSQINSITKLKQKKKALISDENERNKDGESQSGMG